MKDSKNKLLKKAFELFALRGMDGVSTRELVRKAGVNIHAISYYFGGKEGLYEAVVDYVIDFMKEEGKTVFHFKFIAIFQLGHIILIRNIPISFQPVIMFHFCHLVYPPPHQFIHLLGDREIIELIVKYTDYICVFTKQSILVFYASFHQLGQGMDYIIRIDERCFILHISKVPFLGIAQSA